MLWSRAGKKFGKERSSRGWWIRGSCLTIVSYKFLDEIGIWKPNSRRDIPYANVAWAYSLWNFACYPARFKSSRSALLYSYAYVSLASNKTMIAKWWNFLIVDPSKTRHIIDCSRSRVITTVLFSSIITIFNDCVIRRDNYKSYISLFYSLNKIPSYIRYICLHLSRIKQ